MAVRISSVEMYSLAECERELSPGSHMPPSSCTSVYGSRGPSVAGAHRVDMRIEQQRGQVIVPRLQECPYIVAVAVCIQAVAHHPSRHHIGGSALAARYSRCGYQRFLQLECIVIQRVCVHSRMFF